MAKRVIDVLEVVQVKEECRDGRTLPSGACQHLAGTIEDQGSVGKSSERIVECLVVELVRAFPHQLKGSQTAGSQHAELYSQRKADYDATQQQGKCVRVSEYPASGHRSKHLDMPSVVKVDRCRLRPRWCRACSEGDRGGLALIAERHGGRGMVFQGGGENYARENRRSRPPDERVATGLDGVGYDATAIDGCPQYELCVFPRSVGKIGGLTRIAGFQELRPQLGIAIVKTGWGRRGCP